MDFERVLTTLLKQFEEQRIRYAVIGGVALGMLGTARATMDLDFLVHRQDMERVHAILTAVGYQRRACTENVSHYEHADGEWGSVDFLHAFREISVGMLARAKAYPLFDGRLQVRVLEPEDVIGLKVLAIANNPGRYTKDHSDIEVLAERYGARLDWRRIQEYFDLFNLATEGHQLKERFSRAQ